MSDLISRQDAIDNIKECAEAAHDRYEWDMEQGYLNAIECIEELTSAEPDLPIKEKCAFCPHCNNCDVNDDLSIQPCVDTISRRAAIDVCDNAIDLWHGQLGEGIVIAVKKKIEELPSAQPETHEKRTETHACDLISRKDAIDAFLTELTKRERKNLLHTWSTVEVKYFVVEMLEQLPSAQSEITECPMCPDCPDNCPLEVEHE